MQKRKAEYTAPTLSCTCQGHMEPKKLKKPSITHSAWPAPPGHLEAVPAGKAWTWHEEEASTSSGVTGWQCHRAVTRKARERPHLWGKNSLHESKGLPMTVMHRPHSMALHYMDYSLCCRIRVGAGSSPCGSPTAFAPECN